MFLGQMDKPDIDSVEGLSPAISIDQKTTSKNPRSTVGTVTEIYDYLRLLYARIGVPHCPVCGREIRQQTVDQIIDRIMALPDGTRFMVLAPVVRGKKGMHEKVFEDAKKGGYVRARVDGAIYELSEEIKLDKNQKHTVEIVVDRLVKRSDIRPRLADSVETALRLTDGELLISVVLREGETFDGETEMSFSQKYACEEHGISVGELSPRMFSFNNPMGACPRCSGLGELRIISEEKVIPDRSLSLREGAIQVNGFKSLEEESWNGPLFEAVGEKYGFTLDTPIKDYSKTALKALLYGTGNELYDVTRYWEGDGRRKAVKFDGIVNMIQSRLESNFNPDYYEQFVEEVPCPDCHGARLNPMMLAVTVGGKNIDEFCRLSVTKALEFVENLRLTETEQTIAKEILKEVKARLGFLESVGLDYLTLARKAGYSVRRRGAEDTSCDADRFFADGRAVYSRRAVDRSAPEG